MKKDYPKIFDDTKPYCHDTYGDKLWRNRRPDELLAFRLL